MVHFFFVYFFGVFFFACVVVFVLLMNVVGHFTSHVCGSNLTLIIASFFKGLMVYTDLP